MDVEADVVWLLVIHVDEEEVVYEGVEKMTRLEVVLRKLENV